MNSSSFSQKVLDIVSKIPKGQTLTYQEVATMAGRPKAFRAVGNVISKNYNLDVPCHRIIRKDGQKGSYNRGAGLKERLLKLEKEGISDTELRKIMEQNLTYIQL